VEKIMGVQREYPPLLTVQLIILRANRIRKPSSTARGRSKQTSGSSKSIRKRSVSGSDSKSRGGLGMNNSATRPRRSTNAAARGSTHTKKTTNAQKRKKSTTTGRLNNKKKRTVGSKNNNNRRRYQQSTNNISLFLLNENLLVEKKKKTTSLSSLISATASGLVRPIDEFHRESNFGGD
jgi:hypothetical protein